MWNRESWVNYWKKSLNEPYRFMDSKDNYKCSILGIHALFVKGVFLYWFDYFQFLLSKLSEIEKWQMNELQMN